MLCARATFDVLRLTGPVPPETAEATLEAAGKAVIGELNAMAVAAAMPPASPPPPCPPPTAKGKLV